MPEGMTGLELAERLRTEKPGVKVIVSSGYAAELTESTTLFRTGMLYLPKPYQMSQLGNTVRKCLDAT